MATTPVPEMTQEDFDRSFPTPVFHDAKELKNLGFKQDRVGRTWAFFRYPHNWMHHPHSARPTVHDRDLELAIRMRFSDRESQHPEGDYLCLDQWTGLEDAALKELIEQFPRIHLELVGSVQLPLLPKSLTYVDR